MIVKDWETMDDSHGDPVCGTSYYPDSVSDADQHFYDARKDCWIQKLDRVNRP